MSTRGLGIPVIQHEQAVHIVLEHHVVELMNAREVQLGVGPAEHPVVEPEGS